jgi:putative glutamine amidotransferase
MTSKHPPIIGITCTQIHTPAHQHPPRLGQNRSYVHAVIKAGAVPLLIPHLTDHSLLRTLYEQLDGLLLPGGTDVDPALYGESRHEKLQRVDPEQDETELTLARWAMDEGLPLLAICRGIQLLNVVLGGSLYQDIQAQIPEAEKHDWHPGRFRTHTPHRVAIKPQTRLARILDTTSLAVNSLHHQALHRVASGLEVVARAPDQVIEAVEAPEHTFAVAVQWHPEELIDVDPSAQWLFDALIGACRQ